MGKGVVEEMLAKLPEAIAIYREVTKSFPLYEPGYSFLGQVQIKAVLPDEARTTARDLLRLNSQSAYGEFLLAQADWITPGNGQQARPHVVRALELNPRLAEAALLAGKIELQAGEPAKAIEYLKQAVQSEPQLEDGYFLLAKAYRQSGDKKQAEIELATFRSLRLAEDKENHLLSNFLASGGPRP
jgi:tetratricopeptide (TPR) repeat protein